MDRGSIMICILQSVDTNMDRGSIINDLILSSCQMLCCLPCWGMTSILQLRKSASRAKAWKMPWAVHSAWLFIGWCMNYIDLKKMQSRFGMRVSINCQRFPIKSILIHCSFKGIVHTKQFCHHLFMHVVPKLYDFSPILKLRLMIIYWCMFDYFLIIM